MEEIQIDPPIISNFTENYPANEEEDKRIEVEQEDLILHRLLKRLHQLKNQRKSVEKKSLNR